MPDTSVKLQDITPVKSTFDSSDQLLLINATGEARISKADFATELGYTANSKAPVITDTVTGAIANFPDGADDMPVVDLTVNIEPKQDLTYGDPYPAGGGANKLDPATVTVYSSSVYGFTVTWNANDGSLNINGTYTGSGSSAVFRALKVPSAVRSLNVKGFSSSSNFSLMRWQDGADQVVAELTGLAQNSSYNITIYPIVYEGSTAPTSWTPYENICPITGWTGCNVTRVGKNLAHIPVGTKTQSEVTWTCDGTSKIVTTGTASGGSTFSPAFSPLPQRAGTFTASFASDVSGMTCTLTKNGSWFRSISSGGSVTFSITDSDTISGYVSCASGTNATGTSYIQIELGSTATAYEPYQGNTVTVDWTSEAGTVYGGTLDVTTGELTVTDGYIVSYAGETLPSTWISDRDVYASGTTPTTGAEVVYKLATPQTYQLTPQEVRTLLGTNNVWADTGNVSVTYPADTKMFIEKLTMPTEDDLVANQAITSGKYFMIGNSLYLALANIASGAQITIGTNAQRVSLADALNTINS